MLHLHSPQYIKAGFNRNYFAINTQCYVINRLDTIGVSRWSLKGSLDVIGRISGLAEDLDHRRPNHEEKQRYPAGPSDGPAG